MRVLVVGSGAREHALCWRLASEGATVLATPGNVLMTDVADVRAHLSLSELDGIVALARVDKLDLVVVGPEAPLVDGLADRLMSAGITCFGPSAAAARLEASKSFAREVCRSAGVSMAHGASFETVDAAIEYAEMLGAPVVVKADGLAAGKGVSICETLAEAEDSIRGSLEEGRFGAGGSRVVVEHFLEGVEASVIAICDGRDAVMLPAARDHKRLLDDDQGPNTGGMGAFSPVPELDDAALGRLRETIFLPVLREMSHRGAPFTGALFAGLMLTADGPRVLEFNARFGDPETQAIMPTLATPIGPLLAAAASGALADTDGLATIVPVSGRAAVALTLAAHGYPDSPRRGDAISGVDAARRSGALVFGAGVAADNGVGLVTTGGRVVTVVGRGGTLSAAAATAYEAAERIVFAGRQMRRDIGRRQIEVAA
jgi:phosphoribosylamine--glycine ligase